MIEVGRVNRLPICKRAEDIIYFDGGESGPVLLPRRELSGASEEGSLHDVFVYYDAKNHLVATTTKPLVMVGEFAWLTVASITSVGAFLHWGLAKDLLLPFGEQRNEVRESSAVLVRVFLDKQTHRIVASTRIDDFLDDESTEFKSGQAVDLLIAAKTDIGFKAIVNHSHWGILYSNEIFQPLTTGQRIDGFIKKIRDDHRIDLTLYQPGYAQIASVCETIVKVLKQHDGYIMITDKSSPDVVYSVFKVSKKVYKKAIGALYKQQRIAIEKQGVRLIGD